jgi:hypothetical protein
MSSGFVFGAETSMERIAALLSAAFSQTQPFSACGEKLPISAAVTGTGSHL